MGLQGFERRLERLVEGTFAKAFRSGLEPVEIGRKVARALDAGPHDGRARRPVAPNDIVVSLSPDDFERFDDVRRRLARELAEPPASTPATRATTSSGRSPSPSSRTTSSHAGELEVEAEIGRAGEHLGSLVLPDGRRVPLGDSRVIGRLPDCDVVVADPQASRRHAEIRPAGDGFAVVDLGCMNGTTVNGAAVREHVLVDGDQIGIGCHDLPFRGVLEARLHVRSRAHGPQVLLPRAPLPVPLPVVRLTLRELRAPALTAEPAGAPAARRRGRERRPRAAARACGSAILEPAARRGETHAIDHEVTVGRGGGCALVLTDDTYVSQLHARVFQRRRGPPRRGPRLDQRHAT